MPDWHLEEGHSHPDAASFILYGAGQYLTGVSGYAGVPMTNQVNTLLIDGHGQEREGNGHDAFRGVSYDRLNQIRILKTSEQADGMTIEADATAAYGSTLGLREFVRTVQIEKDRLTIADRIKLTSEHTPSILFHFDGDAPPDAAHIDIAEPSDATKKIEPNVITAAGPPGAVDKGPVEQRGTRMVIATAEPVKQAEFKTVLTW